MGFSKITGTAGKTVEEAGIAVWGIINLLEGSGGGNTGKESTGVKMGNGFGSGKSKRERIFSRT